MDAFMNRSEAGKKGYEKTKHILQQQPDEKSRQTRENYEDKPKFCLFCGEKIPYEGRRGKFCNKSCSAKHNNRGVTRHIKGTKVCNCGNPKLPQNKYCSECAQKHVYNRATSVEDAKTDEARKRLLVEHRGYKCETCGLSEWMEKPIPIELHHIDGNSDNNSEDNLQLLCANCHGQCETHKRRNKNGKRQLMRRKRYANGQTW
jgi:hypothetical protein